MFQESDLWNVVTEETVVTSDDSRNTTAARHRQERFEDERRRMVMAAEVQIPLGLRQDQVQPVDELAAEFPELKQSMAEVMGSQLASGTLNNYSSAVGRFQDFCASQGFDYSDLTEKMVIHYVMELNRQQVSYSTLCQVRPALNLLEEMHKGRASAFTPRADRMLDGAMRVAATRRQPVKKATEVNLDWLKEQVADAVWNKLESNNRVDCYKFRLLLRLVLEYYTLCRLSDYQKLQVRHLEIVQGGVQITFPAAKNDQMHRGNVTMLEENGSVICPVRLVTEYCKMLGLRMGREAGDTRHLYCRIRKGVGSWSADKGAPASLSKAREELKQLLQQSGMADKGITDKSFKMLGVTSMMAAGLSAEEVALHGRWKSAEMPLRYKHNSADYKLSISRRIPF